MSQSISIGPLRAWRHEAGAKPRGRIVLVHGLGEHSGRHANTTDFLVSKGFEILRFDQRGCGASEGKRQWIETFGDYSEDLRSVVRYARRELPPAPLFLLGHSLGGAVVLHGAAEVAKDGPVQGIVLSAPAHIPGAGVSAAKIFVGKLLERVLPSLKVPGSLEVGAISRDAAVVDAYKRDPLNCSFNTVRQGNEILRALPQMPDYARKVTQPVLLVHGDADRLANIQGTHAIHKALGSSDKTLKVFPGGYHELHNDLDRGAYFAVLDEWLGKHA